MEYNKKSELMKYIWSFIFISSTLLVLFNFKVKTFSLASIIIPIIFSSCLTSIGDIHMEINRYRLTSIILLCILSYSFDHIIDINLELERDKDLEVHTVVNTYAENEEQDETDENCLPENNILQEITTSVRFITPTQLESEFTSKESYTPRVSEKIIDKILFLHSTFNAEINSVNEYYSKSVEIVKEKVQIALHIEDGYPLNDLNGNKEVVQLLEQANEIDLLRKKDNTIENNVKLMHKYYEAYLLAPCSTISLQLARPYEEIILIYPRNSYEQCNQIFEYGAKGIEYFIQTLAYKITNSSTDGDIIYRIAKIYHCLGDLPNLDIKYRIEMYQISSAYYELSISLKDENDEYNSFKPYYAAMVNHKLGVISNEDNDFYLKRALDYYQKSLFYDDISEQMSSDANSFSAEICNRLINHINKYGQKDGLKSIKFYEELAMEYTRKTLYQ